VADLNQRYMGQTGPTDVLSFPAISGDDIFVMPPGATPCLGDIVIALPFTARQASAQQNPLAAELDLLVVHGVLHLLGYDHDTEIGKAEMWALQDQILASLPHED
jgi:probable rRNA maturation factor